MLKLTERLEKICSCVSEGERVADIGTDHGFLPIALYERCLAPVIIMTDAVQGPLEKARANIARLAPGVSFDIRLGDGLEILECGEADAVVVAGMGGLLIRSIISADMKKTLSIKKYIFQPRNASDALRRWLFENGFCVTDEKLAREGRFICEIICASPSAAARALPGFAAEQKSRGDTAYNDIENVLTEHGLQYEISPLLLYKGDPLVYPFIMKKIHIDERIAESMNKAGAAAEIKRTKLSKRLTGLKAVAELAREYLPD
ncbi:MAG: class I SAM-dependent methyltransferase [Clostridiales Family XIII bacterium]|jgi:tRNA (adenine22-N1)-methyltransferase|nr:class I SAM-dependent methyltransferase [Clostridiales Family XIII bacterium]